MKKILASLALLLALPLRALAADAPPIETFTLDNGLEVIVIPNHRVPAVSHMIWYRVGAADDPPGKSGLAHYHEHMMFEGSEKYKAGEYADIVARHGGEQNAFTGYDATSYYINIAKENLPLAMELEVDRMRGISPTREGAAKEKEVIIEERRSRIENNPGSLLNEQVNAALFRHHPYHLPVIGWMHEMEGLTADDVITFHKKWYHPNNAMLIVSGDITAAELKPLAKKYYGPLPKVAVPARTWNKEPPQIAERRLVMHHVNVKQPEWSRSYMAPSLANGNSVEALPLFLLSQMLGGGKTSLLYQSLVVDRKLASGIDTGYDGFNIGPAQFEITAIPEPGVTLEVLEKAMDEKLAEILEKGVSKEDLDRAKSRLKADSIYARDGLTSMARIMGWIRIVGLDKDYFNRWPQLIDSVTATQINAAAKDLLKPAQSVTSLLLPEEKAEKK